MNEEMGAAFKISCPHCGQHIKFPAHGVGQTIDCPTCSNSLALIAPEHSPVITSSPSEARTSRRSWRADPATEKQRIYLKRFGHVSDRPMTKGEASELIEAFEEDPEGICLRDENWIQAQTAAAELYDSNTAWSLHEELITAQRYLESADKNNRADAKADFRICLRNRTAFWTNTFSAIDSDETSQCLDLWEKFGRHYKKPTVKHINVILEALDSYTPDWDKASPQSFFHTLKKNFPELLR